MANPIDDKCPEIESFLTGLTGKDRREIIRADKCATCNNPEMNFQDDLSRREYGISGMCQRCQDEVFKEYDVEEDES